MKYDEPTIDRYRTALEMLADPVNWITSEHEPPCWAVPTVNPQDLARAALEGDDETKETP